MSHVFCCPLFSSSPPLAPFMACPLVSWPIPTHTWAHMHTEATFMKNKTCSATNCSPNGLSQWKANPLVILRMQPDTDGCVSYSTGKALPLSTLVRDEWFPLAIEFTPAQGQWGLLLTSLKLSTRKQVASERIMGGGFILQLSWGWSLIPQPRILDHEEQGFLPVAFKTLCSLDECNILHWLKVTSLNLRNLCCHHGEEDSEDTNTNQVLSFPLVFSGGCPFFLFLLCFSTLITEFGAFVLFGLFFD